MGSSNFCRVGEIEHGLCVCMVSNPLDERQSMVVRLYGQIIPSFSDGIKYTQQQQKRENLLLLN